MNDASSREQKTMRGSTATQQCLCSSLVANRRFYYYRGCLSSEAERHRAWPSPSFIHFKTSYKQTANRDRNFVILKNRKSRFFPTRGQELHFTFFSTMRLINSFEGVGDFTSYPRNERMESAVSIYFK